MEDGRNIKATVPPGPSYAGSNSGGMEISFMHIRNHQTDFRAALSFSGWADRPGTAESACTFMTGSPRNSQVAQPLSPASFQSRSNRSSVPSEHESDSISDLLDANVDISSNTNTAPEMQHSMLQPSFPSFSNSSWEASECFETAKNQPCSLPTLQLSRSPTPWQVPEAWNCIGPQASITESQRKASWIKQEDVFNLELADLEKT